MALRTLTVQDILWMNLQITRRVNHYSNPRLEEATYYQFGYGDSTGIDSQAARLLSGFVRMKPFDAGNEATALAATLVFLELNDKTLDLDDDELSGLARTATSSMDAARTLICDHIREKGGHHDEGMTYGHGGGGGGSDVRATVTSILQRYPKAIGALETASA